MSNIVSLDARRTKGALPYGVAFDDEARDGSPIVLPYATDYFHTIEMDIPWRYEDRGMNGFKTVPSYRIHPKYGTLGDDALRRYLAPEVRRVANPWCMLWMWVTKDFLPVAFPLMAEMGFDFKQVVIWVKSRQAVCEECGGFGPSFGMGGWLRNSAEFLLLGSTDSGFRPLNAARTANLLRTMGNFADVTAAVRSLVGALTEAGVPKRIWREQLASLMDYASAQVIVAPRGKHSKKPEDAYDMIRRNSPAPRLSMFSRRVIDGFEVWGDEAPSV